MIPGAHLPIAALRGHAVQLVHSMKINEEILECISGNTKAICSEWLLLQILVLVVYLLILCPPLSLKRH